jgi:hypothetical protein
MLLDLRFLELKLVRLGQLALGDDAGFEVFLSEAGPSD